MKKEKIFCVNCRYRDQYGCYNSFCRHDIHRRDTPIYPALLKAVRCEKFNRNNNCRYFKPQVKNPTLFQIIKRAILNKLKRCENRTTTLKV